VGNEIDASIRAYIPVAGVQESKRRGLWKLVAHLRRRVLSKEARIVSAVECRLSAPFASAPVRGIEVIRGGNASRAAASAAGLKGGLGVFVCHRFSSVVSANL
jgi:hypothetical protein